MAEGFRARSPSLILAAEALLTKLEAHAVRVDWRFALRLVWLRHHVMQMSLSSIVELHHGCSCTKLVHSAA